MSRFFRGLLGMILLVGTVGLATCQSLVKADALPAQNQEINVRLNGRL